MDLSNARLESIAYDAFSEMKNMSKLDLSGNSLIDLPRLPETLETADLSELLLTRLSKTMLENLHELRHVTFVGGLIEVIEDGAFMNMTEMEDLDLSENQIRSLSKNVFYFGESTQEPNDALKEVVNSLKALNLSSNDISEIEGKAFAALDHLEVLNLQGNSLEVIETQTFKGLKKLVELNLNTNEIQDIVPGALDELAKLEVGAFDFCCSLWDRSEIQVDGFQNFI